MTDSLKLGIAGLGTVGSSLIRLLARHEQACHEKIGRVIEVCAVSTRDRHKDRGLTLPADVRWFADPCAMAVDPEIDVFVELIGGEEGVAKEAVERALGAGKHVVTANKALLAHHGGPLAQLAESANLALNYEAAIAGGIPIVKTLRESLLGNEITRLYGILNGTCNYILTRMETEGQSFQAALKDAQEAGFAEADPTFDIGGIDSAHKLALLTSLAFGTEPAFSSIYVEGIDAIAPADIEAASDLGYRIKLLGVALKTESGIEQRVHPTMVPKNSAIADVGGVTNCVAVEGDFIGDVMLVGPGAGGEPTASSVMSDIIDIARGLIIPPLLKPASALLPYQQATIEAHQGGYYIYLSVYDRSGAFAAIATRMAEHDISLKSIVQRPLKSGDVLSPSNEQPEGPLSVMIITHDTTEKEVRAVLQAIEKDGNVAERPRMIRIEKL